MSSRNHSSAVVIKNIQNLFQLTSTLAFFLLLCSTPYHAAAHASPQDVSTVTASTLTVQGPTVTTYVASPSTPASPQYTDSLTFRTSLLNSTNFYRWQHNASDLAWNDSLASYASSYAAKCVWAHSHAPEGYGENLARGYPDVESAVDAWGNERSLYTFTPGAVTGFTEATGHFTQLVWKNTQTVGCGAFACDGMNGIGGYMLVCEYWPPGNIEGTGANVNQFFAVEVQDQVNSGDNGFNAFSATVGATGVGTSWATGTVIPTVTVTSSGGSRLDWSNIFSFCWVVSLLIYTMLQSSIEWH